MLLYLVRHGETDYNKDSRCQGWVDIPLNAAGRRHAGALGEWFREREIDAIYASPLRRAMDTARAIAAARDVAITSCDGLKELHQGELDGLTVNELMHDHGDLVRRWYTEPAGVVMPGGESMEHLSARMWDAWTGIKRGHAQGDVIVLVSHKLSLLTLQCRLLDIPLNSFRRLTLDPGCVSSVQLKGPVPMLREYNIRPDGAAAGGDTGRAA